MQAVTTRASIGR